LEELKRIRESRGLSQAKLAQLAGLNPVTVHRIEHGHKSPTVKTLESLAQVLDVEVGDLFPKVGRRSSAQPSLLNGLDERHEYPYPWMAASLARVIDDWRRILEDPSKRQGFAKDPAYIRGVSVACFDIAASVVLIESDTFRSGEEWDRLPEDEKSERLLVAKQLDALARQALAQYKASEVAQEAEVHEIERRREEIRRRTQELGQERSA
jgi:transcriptional regulator with XRE-family HTH domain